jgi:hypothetical protein
MPDRTPANHRLREASRSAADIENVFAGGSAGKVEEGIRKPPDSSLKMTEFGGRQIRLRIKR